MIRMGAIRKEIGVNQLLEAVITNKEARTAQALHGVAAQSADAYLPWSSESGS